jgi:ABC-type antimicrobial peptide transport system permease subunit
LVAHDPALLGDEAPSASVAARMFWLLTARRPRRTREIGVRMALGAEGGVVRRMVVAQGGRVALIGVAVGVLASIGLTRYLENLLFGVQPLDVLTFTAVSVVMVGVALLASYLPARRASLVDPVVALRAE